MKFLENGHPNPNYVWSLKELKELGKRALQRLHFSATGTRTKQGEKAEPIIDKLVSHYKKLSSNYETLQDVSKYDLNVSGIAIGKIERQSFWNKKKEQEDQEDQVIRLVPPSPYRDLSEEYEREDPSSDDESLEVEDYSEDLEENIHRYNSLAIDVLHKILERVDKKLDILIGALTKDHQEKLIEIPDIEELKEMSVGQLQIILYQVGKDMKTTNKDVLLYALEKYRKTYTEIVKISKEYDVSQKKAKDALALHVTTGTPILSALEML